MRQSHTILLGMRIWFLFGGWLGIAVIILHAVFGGTVIVWLTKMGTQTERKRRAIERLGYFDVVGRNCQGLGGGGSIC